MLGRTHLLTSFFLSLIFIKLFSFSHPLIFTLVLLFASVFPDIDSKNSLIGRHFKFLNSFFKHRGIFHSIFILILLIIILWPIGKYISLAFTIGFTSHLFLDLISKEGLRFWPIGKIKGFIKVGGFYEKIFSLIIMVLIILTFIKF